MEKELIVRNTSDYKSMSLEETLGYLKSSEEGLSAAEAKYRLQIYGYNEIKEEKENPLARLTEGD